MDHARLKPLLFLTIACLSLWGCASKETARTRDPRLPISVLESEFSPRQVFNAAETYLTYHLGFNLSVRDLERGLIVSDWSREDPLQREQITLRIQPNLRGSVVSAHLRTEAFSQSGWQDLPTSGSREARFLSEFETYLSAQAKAPKK